MKATNPKLTIGATKAPLSRVPLTFLAEVAAAMHNGACKYGTANWRVEGARASVYLDAALRHIHAWADGEETDEEGIHNLGAAASNLAILVDADYGGWLTDDRATPGQGRAALSLVQGTVRSSTERHKDARPVHQLIHGPEQDNDAGALELVA